MKEPEKKKHGTAVKKKKISAASRIKLLILFGVLAYTLAMTINQQATLNHQRERQQELIAQKEALEADKEYYLNELEYIGTDNYIIKEAKERLGWLFSDEVKYVSDK